MKVKDMGKLIRTKLEGKIKQKQPNAKFSVLNRQDLVSELDKKLLEEVTEFLAASSTGHRNEELADILEVLKTYFSLNVFDQELIEQVQTEKFKERGGFTEGIYYESEYQ